MSYDPYEKTSHLSYGDLFVFPDVPGAAGVQNGCVGVWTRGTHADYWHERKATAEEIAAFDAAKAIAQKKPAAAAAPQPPPVVAAPALAAGNTLSPPAGAAKTDWATILARAEQSGEMTDELRAQGLRLLANPPATVKPDPKSADPKSATPIDTNAIYADRAKRANVDDVIAKLNQRM